MKVIQKAVVYFSLLSLNHSFVAGKVNLLRGTDEKTSHDNNQIENEQYKSNRNLQANTTTSACGFPCGERASCIVNNDDGTAICVCDEGWKIILDPKDGRFLGCEDRDECVEDEPCREGAICVDHDPPDMYSCICPDDGPQDADGNCIQLFAKSVVETPSPSSMPSSAPSTPAPSFTNGITYRDTCPDTENEDVIVSQTFDDGSSSSWSNSKTSTTTDGNIFLGPYYKSDSNPSQTISIDATGVSRVGISFDFYEIGSFDGSGKNGPDTLSVQVSGDITDTVDLGSFHYNSDDTGKSTDTSSSGIIWNMLHTPTDESPQTSLFESWRDQHHVVYLDIPRSFFSSSGQFTITILWGLTGASDEAVGIDNFKVSRCVDTVPSMTPSLSPTSNPTPSPTSNPTPSPTTTPSVCGNPSTGPGCVVSIQGVFPSVGFSVGVFPVDSSGTPRGASATTGNFGTAGQPATQVFSFVYTGDRIDVRVFSFAVATGQISFAITKGTASGDVVASGSVPYTYATPFIDAFVTVFSGPLS